MIWFAGDLHGQFRHLFPLVQEHEPEALILLGDIEATRPLEKELEQILDVTDVWWIPGNHDTDRDITFDNLFASALAEKNLHGRVVEIDGRDVGGLGGIFREEVWMPPAEHRYMTWMELVADTPVADRWRGGIPRKHHSTIFPNNFYFLAAREVADILVCHEAPGCHTHGVEMIDHAAHCMRVKSVFHGHHHDSPDYSAFEKDMGFKTFGVGLRGITDEFGNRILAGERDLERITRSFNDARRMTLYPNAFK